MKTTFDVLDLVYPVVNVTAVKNTLDGAVYRNARLPESSATRDIVVMAAPIDGGTDKDIQNGTIYINCFAPDTAPGIADDANLDTMTAAVITVIEAYSSTSEYLDLEIVSQGTFDDIDKAGVSYSSIRINYEIQFNAP